jgi:hypothetical protein
MFLNIGCDHAEFQAVNEMVSAGQKQNIDRALAEMEVSEPGERALKDRLAVSARFGEGSPVSLHFVDHVDHLAQAGEVFALEAH